MQLRCSQSLLGTQDWTFPLPLLGAPPRRQACLTRTMTLILQVGRHLQMSRRLQVAVVVAEGEEHEAGRRRARRKKVSPPAPSPAPTPAPTAAPAPEKFNPSIAFEQSKSHAAVRATGPVQVGNKVAYYLVLPDNLGGTEWYVGEVVRVSHGNWVDVKFVDGALWCSFKET